MQELTVIVPIAKMSGKLANLAKWLPEAIRNDIQVVLVHDEQDDETGTEIRNLLDSFNSDKIKLLELKAGSPGHARNFGVPFAQTNWVIFWDSDDLPLVDNALIAIAEAEDDTDAICCQYVSRSNSKSQQKSKTYNKKQLALNPGIWRILLKRELLENRSFTDFLMGEDQVFLLDIGLYSARVKFSNLCTYTYFVGDENQATRNVKSINDLQRAIDYLQDKYDANNSFANLVILKMTVTLIRKGEVTKKIWGILNLLKNPNRSMITIGQLASGRSYE